MVVPHQGETSSTESLTRGQSCGSGVGKFAAREKKGGPDAFGTALIW
jgi:hypothetical protein